MSSIEKSMGGGKVERNGRFPNRVVLARECDSLEEYEERIKEGVHNPLK